MDPHQALYEETQHCIEKVKAFLLEISRSPAAERSPSLADRAALIRERFHGLSGDIDQLWREYARSSGTTWTRQDFAKRD
jgi:hypothetical protein